MLINRSTWAYTTKPTTPDALHHQKQSLCTSFDIHPPLAKIQLKLKLEIKITIIKLTI